jgi:hypothetical protein
LLPGETLMPPSWMLSQTMGGGQLTHTIRHLSSHLGVWCVCGVGRQRHKPELALHHVGKQGRGLGCDQLGSLALSGGLLVIRPRPVSCFDEA